MVFIISRLPSIDRVITNSRSTTLNRAYPIIKPSLYITLSNLDKFLIGLHLLKSCRLRKEVYNGIYVELLGCMVIGNVSTLFSLLCSKSH